MTQESNLPEIMVNAQSRLIHVPSQLYPVTLATVKLPFPVAFGNEVPLSYLKENGNYDLVMLTPAPEGDVVTEMPPAMDADGHWVQQFHVREFNADELLAKLEDAKTTAEAYRQNAQSEALAAGAEFDFGGDYGVKHVQMRSDDRVNVSGLAIKVLRNPAHTDVFCCAENIVIPVTGEQITEMSDRVLAAYTKVMSESWTLRELISSASKIDDVPTKEEIDSIFADAIALN